MSRWIHTVQNATCAAKNCESPLSGAISSLGKTSTDSNISLTEESVRVNPDVLKAKERIRKDENEKGKYESHLQNETNTDTTSSLQPDSSEKISKTPRIRPILKCWSDIWPFSTNTYLQRKEISSKFKYSPKEHPKEENHEKCKENTKISIKDKMNIDTIGMKEKVQEKAEVKEKIEEDMPSSISSFSPLENLEAKSSSSDITHQMHPIKDLSSNRNRLLADSNIPSHGTKRTESIGSHLQLNTLDVSSVLVVPSVPGVLRVQDVPSSPDKYVQSVPVDPSISAVPSVQDVPLSPGVYSVQDVPSVPNGPDITGVQITCADAVISPVPAEGENYFFQAMVDKRYNRWKRRRQKKEKLVRPRTCLPSAYSNTSSSSEEDVRRRAISGYGTYVQNVVNSNKDLDCRRSKAGKKRCSGTGSRKGSHRKMPKEDETTKLNGYDASSEYTSSEKEQVQGRESDSDNDRSIHESNLNSDDNSCPVMKQQKHLSISTIDVTSSDLLDVLGNDLWLPPINDQMISSERKPSPEDLCQSDINEMHLSKLQKKRASSLEQPGLKEALHKKVHRQSIQMTQSKSRITKQSTNSQEISRLRMKQGNSVLQTISRFRSSAWIDPRMKSETLSRMSFIAPTGRPLKSYSQLMKSRTGTVKKKDFLPSACMQSITKTSDKSKASDEKPYLPMLLQNSREQTIPKLKNRLEAVEKEVSRSIINPVSRKTCEISAKGASNSRCRSDPQKKQSKPSAQLSITATHMLPYKRKLDARSHSKYHVQHTTVTPKSSWAELQEGNKRLNLQRKTESALSSLSFTPAFTFSIFKLPLDYKLRNEKWRQIMGHPLKHKT
ncbi:hypothetical protein CHS0354_008294 [Potamilus streckersoni]|uniref:Uncharacterized protein n=1 Tax=Potamilus streckersoni TaxID=2493646 RepID=A0AAE0RRC9_9BIVA|nr:hypothetical protein CHS0354_008294 [Potamilus streckersoni]